MSTSNEELILSRCPNANVSKYEPETYTFPFRNLSSKRPPVVVGMGPGGLFAALSLSEAGLRPVILERGRPVEQRMADVSRFWAGGALDTASSVQFGEGGAGTFSDGKLSTGINNRRISHVLETFVKFGAPEDILYSAKPHIGTDILRTVVANMRARLLERGCRILFEHKMTSLVINDGALQGVRYVSPQGEGSIETSSLILAPGNSARDTFAILHEQGIKMEPKGFAVGVRIEHLQKDIDAAQYGQAATLGTLPASDYKMAVHLPDGRSVFTFCVCPGGSVVAAASEHGGVVTNGMSQRARDGKNINGGLLVGLSPEDFNRSLFGGIEFQRQLERQAFRHGGQNYRAPAQLVGDFLAGRPSKGPGTVLPTYSPGVTYCNLWDVLPEFVCRAIAQALPLMEKDKRVFFTRRCPDRG